MVDFHVSGKNHWLSLRDACRFLDVSQGALRQWADGGFLRVYRTPGGHRRFMQKDLQAFAEGNTSHLESGKRGGLEGSALRLIQRRLRSDTVASRSWYSSVEPHGRDRMRLFGRRLLSILAQQPHLQQERRGALDEAYLLGEQYGSEMFDRGVTFEETLEAFIFFRNIVLDSATANSWSRILKLADRVLLAVAGAYQNRASLEMPRPTDHS